MLVVLTGIPGSGKTTVAKKALEVLGDAKSYEMVTYGTVMFEIAQSEGHVKDRDEMRKLPVETQKKIQEAAAEKINEKARAGDVILDTHCTISTPGGYIPGLPANILDKLKPELFILVEADSADINTRRESDKSRSRDDEGVAGIQKHQDVNRAYASAYSTRTGAAVKIVDNAQGKLEETAASLAEVLK